MVNMYYNKEGYVWIVLCINCGCVINILICNNCCFLVVGNGL